MRMNRMMKFLTAAVLLMPVFLSAAVSSNAKWLVLDPITYQAGVSRLSFDGIDGLLLTKLVQAKKYKCLDRDAYNTAAREEGFGAKVELIPAGYSMRGEVVQMTRTGKTRTLQGALASEYVATVSLRANNLRTQQAYEAETLRIRQFCLTPKDMLIAVVQRVALAILIRDYPMKIMDDEDGEFTLNYGKDFLNVGEQYEIRRRKALEDEDTGEVVYKETVTGVCEVTDVGSSTSTARLISGKGKVKNVLRFYDKADPFEPPPAVPQTVASAAPAADAAAAVPPARVYPVKKYRIAVAPFISKQTSFSVYGMGITSRTWMDDVAEHLSIALTQTESFKVLDRSFGPEIDRELTRITTDPNASPDDVCRLSNKLAADYLVVAEVVFSNVASPGQDFATGLPLPPPSVAFAEVRFRCVAAPTTQIAWADTIRMDASRFGGTPEVYSSTSAQAAAGAICDAIQSRLDPAGFARIGAARQAAAAAAAAAAQQPPAQAPIPAPPAGVNLGF